MFCPKCGLTINGNASKCPRCLTKIPVGNQTISPQNSGARQTAPVQHIPNPGYQAPQQSAYQPCNQHGAKAPVYPSHRAYQQTTCQPNMSGYPPFTIVALVCGILGMCGGLIPVVHQYFTLVLSILAVIFGVLERKKAAHAGQPTGMATAGLVLGVVSIVLTLVVIAFAGAVMVWLYSIFDSQF